MQVTTLSTPTTGKKPWAGYILSGLVILFLVMDAGMKLVSPVPPPVAEATAKLGWPLHLNPSIAIVLFLSTLLYAVPRTSILGAILLTGYLGGAVAVQVRADMPPFSIAFPIIFGVIVWGGLYLRDARIRVLIPLKQP